jgi:3-deoxy-manno-octulosonate cytidylyltransferase (CMP-KDO synthetase)
LTAAVVIPARYGSTRFPAKILASATGRPLVQHVVDQARLCTRVREIIVATDDSRIVAALSKYETRTVMTRVDHQSGTDRIAEVAQSLSDDIIINVQGDEPEISPSTIDAVIESMQHFECDMATVITPFAADADLHNPNIVKAVVATDGRALYFSRAMIPYQRDPTYAGAPPYYHHLGIYGYRRSFLLKFASWKPSVLEQTEKLEQLRALEHGATIQTIMIDHAPPGIDTAEQYEEFVIRSGQFINEPRP